MTHPAASAMNPFPGLRPFRENEEHLFFGREGQVDTMVDKLSRHRFLAVLGTSGSGKSSLVNCGLRPALHRGLMGQAGTAWRIAQFRPGRDPIGALAEALAADGLLFPASKPGRVPVREIVDDTLRMSKLGLVDVVQQARLEEHVNVLVVADQFEELFRYRQTVRNACAVEDATAFVNLLLEASSQRERRIYVVLTMRSDFLGDCAQFPGLAEAINRGQYLVPRLTREERRAAIAGPIAVGGGTISPVLLTRLVNDVGDNPDQLSILQHALNRTWAYWMGDGGRKGPLSIEHYDKIGTMAGALNQHAEKAFGELGEGRQRQICKKVFETLTDMGTDARGIRRPSQFQTLCAVAGATPEEVSAVIDVFRRPSRSFVMPPAGDPLEADTVVDISHESLMRLWKRLDQWAHEEAEFTQLYRRLADAARRHARGQASLWTDPELQFALDWREHSKPTAAWADLYGGDYDVAMGFLEASERERKRLADEDRAERERDLEQARQLAAARAKTAKLTRVGSAILALLAIGASIQAWESMQDRDKAVGLKNAADRAKVEADLASAKAQRSQQEALEEKGVAEAAARDAARARERALAESKRARAALTVAEKARSEMEDALAAASDSERAAEASAKVAVSAKDEARKNYLDSLRFQASSFLDGLVSLETPPSPSDHKPIWQLFEANDELTNYSLDMLLQPQEGSGEGTIRMRKAITRGYALRRSLIGFNGRRDALVRKALDTHCTAQNLSNLYLAGVCISLERGFFPANVDFVLRVEDAFRQNWTEWGNRQNYPILYEQNIAVLEQVELKNFLFLIDSLDSAGAGQVAERWMKDLTVKARWSDHLLRVWSRAVDNMKSGEADRVAGLLLGSETGKALEARSNPGQNPLAILSAATGAELTARLWTLLLEDPQRCLDRSWLFSFNRAAPKLSAKDAGVLQRRLIEVYPEKETAVKRNAWLSTVRALAPRMSRDEAVALAQKVMDQGAPTMFRLDTVAALAAREDMPNLTRTIESTKAALSELMTLEAKLGKDPFRGAVRPSPMTPKVLLARLDRMSRDKKIDAAQRQRLGDIATSFRAAPASVDPFVVPLLKTLVEIKVKGRKQDSTEVAMLLKPRVAEMLKAQTSQVAASARQAGGADLALAVVPRGSSGSEADRANSASRAAVARTEPFSKVAAIQEEIVRRTAVLVGIQIQAEEDPAKKAALADIHKEAQGSLDDPKKLRGLQQDIERAPYIEEYRKLIQQKMKEEPVFAVLTGPPSGGNEGKAARTVASYMRQESRFLLTTPAFSALVNVLVALRTTSEDRRAVMDELLRMNRADRSIAVCYRLESNNEASSTALRLLTAWGTDVDKQVVENILQWPDCPPNAVFPVVRKLAELKREPPRELGNRNGLLVMEQFAYWARQHGYKFAYPPK